MFSVFLTFIFHQLRSFSSLQPLVSPVFHKFTSISFCINKVLNKPVYYSTLWPYKLCRYHFFLSFSLETSQFTVKIHSYHIYIYLFRLSKMYCFYMIIYDYISHHILLLLICSILFLNAGKLFINARNCLNMF